MTSLGSLPNELSWAIASSLEIEDVISLSRTSRRLYHYVFSDQVSRAVAQAKIPLSREFITATQSGTSSAQALRKWAKKTEALATAKPYSIAIVGVGQTYMYSKGALWYMHNGTLRLLQTRQSPTEELVVDLSSLLHKTAFKGQSKVAGSFSFLHYHEGVLSCLFRYSHPRRGGWLIAVDVNRPAILLSTEVVSTEKLFARHDGDYLYYGVHICNDYDNRKRWVLHGYDLKSGKFMGRNNFLHDLIGAEIGSSICFEIMDGFFYAVSNQTTYEVEEVDWTSFYHGRRFPLSNPSENELEKTEDKCMWRRQHLEGPLDDRWTSLALAIDETTGQLTIVESRKEWLEGRTVGQRTVYKTNVVFPKEQPVTDNTNVSHQANAAPPMPHASPNTFQSFGNLPFASTSDYPSPSSEHQRRKDLAALTQDRLALTITASNKPHFSPSQTRLPRNVHAEPVTQPGERSFVVTKTPARGYDMPASTFVDLVNDIPHADPGVQQCLRIRTCSRRRKGPACGADGIMPLVARNPETGEQEEEGLDEEYEDGAVEMWPPAPDVEGTYSEAGRELHALMNPLGYTGKVQGAFDGTALVYSTGGERAQKAIVMVNFDPAVHLHGLKKCSMEDLGSGTAASSTFRASRSQSQEASGGGSPKRPNSSLAAGQDAQSPKRTKTIPSPSISPQAGPHAPAPAPGVAYQGQGCSWLRREPASYLSIARGFDFGL